MNQKQAILAILTAALNLAACAPRSQDCNRNDIYCVGLVTASGSIDQGINQQAWQGLQEAQARGLADRIDYIETVDSRDRAKNIAVLAGQGYDLIVTAGYGLAEETAAAAQQYPLSKFVGIEQPETNRLPNLVQLVFPDDRGGFLAGALAAFMSQTHRIGAVCEARFIDSIRRACEGFQAGARYAKSNTIVKVVFREGPTEMLFNDPQWGDTTALQLVNDGADVIFAGGGQTAEAALQTAAGQGAAAIGWESDAYLGLPDARPRLVSSAVDDIRSGVLDLIQQARTGNFPSGVYPGQTGLAPFHDWDRQIPDAIKQQLEAIQQGLKDGSIQTGVP